MTTSLRIGIDIGGTNLRLGIVRGSDILHLHHEPIGRNRQPADLGKRLADILAALPSDLQGATHVGIGLPGIVDFKGQRVLRSPHFPEWINVPFGEVLSDALGLPVTIDNDANMVLRGEKACGAAKPLQHAIMLTLGTGIGGGILINDTIFHGTSGFAGEVGHMVIDRHGLPCPCGGRGCWELYASAQAFDQPPHTVTDPEQWDRFGANLGTGIASLVNVLGIEDIVIGGGLSNAWDQFSKAMYREIPRHTYTETSFRIRIHRALLGDKAGILGAASFIPVRGELVEPPICPSTGSGRTVTKETL